MWIIPKPKERSVLIGTGGLNLSSARFRTQLSYPNIIDCASTGNDERKNESSSMILNFINSRCPLGFPSVRGDRITK